MTKKHISKFSEASVEFQPYIKELRKELFKIGIVFLVGFALGVLFYQQILTYLMSFFNFSGINLVLTSPYQFIGFSIKTGIMTGILIAFPSFLISLLKFIKPALAAKEYQLLLKLLPLSIALFIMGFIFGVWVVQFVIDLYSETTAGFQVENIWDLSGFFTQVIVAGFSLALVFQLPIFLTVLIRLAILELDMIKRKRKAIYTVLIIAAAILSPGVDMFSFFIFAIVSLFLFEFTLVLNRKS